MTFNTFYSKKEHRELVTKNCKRIYYKSKIRYVMEYEDFEQEMILQLVKYISSFNETKSKITTYVPNIITSQHNRLLQTLNYKKRDINTTLNSLSLDYTYGNNEEETVTIENFITDNNQLDMLDECFSMNEDFYIQQYTSMLDNELDKKIFTLKFKGKTIREISIATDEVEIKISRRIKEIKQRFIFLKEGEI